MNANELSLELRFYAEGFSGDFSEHLKKAATMLRQQQAEIEALKAELENVRAETGTYPGLRKYERDYDERK